MFVRIIGSKKFYRDLFKMQAELGNYDVAISYFNDIPNSYFNRGTNQYVEEFIKAPIKVAWVHTDPEKAMFNYEECVEIYRSFDKIICVSEACKKKFAEFLPQYEAKTGVVYNIFPVNEIKEMATEYIPFNHNGLINLVSVGRIDNKTKRFNLIPEICKRLSNFGITNFYWRIVGSGHRLESNRKLVTELEVDDYVEFVGERTNPYPFIKSSHLFVLTSAYEGFPMVIGESLLLETPVLTTNYAAVNEQVKMGVNGIVVDQDIDSIVSGLRQLLTNQELIERMAEGMKEHPFTNRIANTQLKHAIGGSDE